jgi:hypothetical protein
MSTPYACPNCGTTDVKRFHKNRSMESGLQTHCYACQKTLWGNRHVALALQRSREAAVEDQERREVLEMLAERLETFLARVRVASLDELAVLEGSLPAGREEEGRTALYARLDEMTMGTMIQVNFEPVNFEPVRKLAAAG